MARTNRTGWTVSLVVLVAGGACTGGDDEPPQAFGASFAAYLAGGLDSTGQREVEAVVFRETQNMVAECMVELGFEYVPEDDPSRFQSPPRGFLTEADVAAHGYGLVADLEYVTAELDLGPNDVYVRELSPAEQTAYSTSLDGGEAAEGRGGCLERGRREALIALGVEDLTDAALDGLGPSTLDDPLVVAADQEWRRCVAALGIETSAPSIVSFLADLSAEFDQRLVAGEELDELQAEEIALAQQMLTCNQARNEVLVEVQEALLISPDDAPP